MNVTHFARNSCHSCKGSGRIEWKSLKDGMWLMSEEISFRVWTLGKKGLPIKTFSQLMRVARNVKSDGAECSKCFGTGDV